jgi:hypothetical protein
LLCAAAVLHLVLVVAVYGLGRYALSPGTFDENGVAVAFASDGVRYRADAAALSEALRRGEVRSWAGANHPFHVKLYSVCFALFGPALGFNVVGAAPLNAFFYVAVLSLVFGLGREVFGRRAGLLAAAGHAWENELGPLLTSAQVRELLGDVSRQRVDELLRARRLIGLRDSAGRRRFPSFQFHAGRPLEPLVGAYWTVADGALDDWTAASWCVSPDEALDGRTPAQWALEGRDPARLARIARQDAARLAR